MAANKKHCIIGAGYCGLGVAKSFLDHGIEFDWFERNAELGGNWLNGVYDSTHIISSRDTTGYQEFPMPRDYPDFPSRAQMLSYLRSYAEHFKLVPLIRFNTEVASIEPVGGDATGMSGWTVTLASGEKQDYAGVIVANGHHWNKRYPSYPGTFTGKVIHSKDYKNAADFAGNRVLVVGAGNSGCDISVEAASNGHETWMSMRRGYYFLPKTMFGVPVAELDQPWFPVWAQKLVIKGALKLISGDNTRYGLQKPDHELFASHPIVNSQLLYFIRHGRVQPKPDIERLDGKTVQFKDGSKIEVDTIVWATGFNISFPFLDHSYFEWENGIPKRIASFLPPGKAGLYIFGLGQPRGGAGPLISASARLLSEMILAQRALKRPLASELARFVKPETRYYVGVVESFRRIKAGRFLIRQIARRAGAPRPRLRAVGARLEAVPRARNVRFPFTTAEIPKHWYFGRPLQTHYANALGMLFPAGERFFIRAVKEFQDQVSEPALKERVKGFAAQEYIHGREHERFTEVLSQQGYEVSGFMKWYERLAFEKLEKLFPKRMNLSATVAFEHFTAALAHEALTKNFLRHHAHPTMRDLYMWHATEEIEHKSVAFDVLQDVAPGYFLRVQGIFAAWLIFNFFCAAGQITLLRQDKDATIGRVAGDFVQGLRDGFYFNGTMAKAIVQYLKPGFHPSQVDDLHLAENLVKELEARYAVTPRRGASPDGDTAAWA